MKKPTTTFQALRHFPRLVSTKKFVFIASAQRSGSTLLKALLATAPDVSHLPEVPIHLYGRSSAWQLKSLSEKDIIVLKKPSWPKEVNYPSIPPVGKHKLLLLVRHPYETLISTGKMYEKIESNFWDKWSYESMLYEYWLPTYEGMLKQKLHLNDNTKVVQYEELTANPVSVTKSLFAFIGSEKEDGVDTYKKKPENWTFMTDDGSDKIKSLKVQTSTRPRDNKDLLQLIHQEPRVTAVLNSYGYTP